MPWIVLFSYLILGGLLSYVIGINLGTTVQLLFLVPYVVGSFFVGLWAGHYNAKRR